MSPLEIGANAFNTASILLAGRNSVHTWWTGIVGCLLFARVFFTARLYADTTLQVFFIATSVLGWWRWRVQQREGQTPIERPIRHTPPRLLVLLGLAGVVVTAGYGWLLHRFTDAYAPMVDSTVLVFSVLGQLLLVGRRVESWWCWLLVNTVSVPLLAARGLYLTSGLYLVFWVNAVVSLRRWRRLAVAR
jgi:nicotinamide mononucleotide transporter